MEQVRGWKSRLAEALLGAVFEKGSAWQNSRLRSWFITLPGHMCLNSIDILLTSIVLIYLLILLVYWANIYISARSICMTLKYAALRAYLKVNSICWLRFLFLFFYLVSFVFIFWVRVLDGLQLLIFLPRQEPPNIYCFCFLITTLLFSVLVNREPCGFVWAKHGHGGQSESVTTKFLLDIHSLEQREQRLSSKCESV